MDASTLSLLRQFRNLEYAQISLHIFFICDYVYLLPREVDIMWSRRWGKRCVGRLLYVLCRYTAFFTFGTVIYSVAAPANDSLCLGLGTGSSWFSTLGEICAQLAFFLRAYALWNASPVIGVLLVILAAGMIGSAVSIEVILMKSTALLHPPIQDPAIIPNCFLTVNVQPEVSMWGVIGVVIIDSILMALAVAAKFKMRYSLNDHSLAARVYRDGIYYFAINLSLSITSIVLYNELQGPLKEVSAIFSSIMSRCLSCHILLRLRELSSHGLPATLTGPSLGPLEFQQSLAGEEICMEDVWEGIQE